MSAPFVTVIVPIYNVAPFLDRCLRSLELQTFRDMEVILVDDCSTDGSLEIARRYAESSESWRLVVHDGNKGLSGARNTGIALARGSYIGFVDSDDWTQLTMFETLARVSREYDADVSQVDYALLSSDDEPLSQPGERVFTMTGRQALAQMLEQERYAVWFRIYRRELFDGIGGGWFPEGLTCEDRVFNSWMLPRAARVAQSNRIEYVYFQNRGSLSFSGLTARGLDLLEADRRMVRFVEGLGDEQLLKLARDRAAKGPYSLLVKWARFGVTDAALDADETLSLLWDAYRANYCTVMKSQLSLAKKIVAWQLRYCSGLLKLEMRAYERIARVLRRGRGA